jgi:hypothetical protein
MACARANIELSICEGADYEQAFIWKSGSTPTEVDLTGYTAEMQIRTSYDGDVLLELTTDNGGIVLADQVTDTGKYSIAIDSTDTVGLCVNHHDVPARYDLFLISPTGARRLHQYGRAMIYAAVTRDVS